MHSRLRLYLAVIRVGLSSAMEYRMNYITNAVLGVVIYASVQMYMWYAVFQSRGVEQVAGMDLSAMLVYLCFSVMCFTLTRNGLREREPAGLIRSGGLNMYLLKPVSLALYTFCLAIAERLSQLLFVIIPTILLILFLSTSSQIPFSMVGFLFALPIIILGAIMNFLMSLGISYLAFWLDEVWTFQAMKDIAMGLLSGMMFPLSALPPFWRDLSTYLPFQFLSYIPAALMSGSISSEQAPLLLLQAMGGTMVCAVVVWSLWRMGLKRYAAFGG